MLLADRHRVDPERARSPRQVLRVAVDGKDALRSGCADALDQLIEPRMIREGERFVCAGDAVDGAARERADPMRAEVQPGEPQRWRHHHDVAVALEADESFERLPLSNVHLAGAERRRMEPHRTPATEE